MFENSPFDMLDKAFKALYPGKRYKAYFDLDMKDEQGESVYGFTQFPDDGDPIIAVSAELSIKCAVEIFAHELAHVAAGKQEGHGEILEKCFDGIFNEYNRMGEELCRTVK